MRGPQIADDPSVGHMVCREPFDLGRSRDAIDDRVEPQHQQHSRAEHWAPGQPLDALGRFEEGTEVKCSDDAIERARQVVSGEVPIE